MNAVGRTAADGARTAKEFAEEHPTMAEIAVTGLAVGATLLDAHGMLLDAGAIKKVNSSLGAQIQHQIKNLQVGDKITKVTIIGGKE